MIYGIPAEAGQLVRVQEDWDLGPLELNAVKNTVSPKRFRHGDYRI
jgi:hypothetical protein